MTASLIGREFRPARASDIQEIVRIHQAAFPEFFMTMLGARFLSHYYRLVLNHPGNIFFIKEGPDGLDGFVSGFLNPAEFYKEMQKKWLGLMGSVVLRTCTHPWLLPRMFASYREARRSGQTNEPGSCELSSIAVLPDRSGQGIGKGLIKVFIEAVQGRAQFIVLTTDAKKNDIVNDFYRNLGFILVESYERSKGRTLNRYRLFLAG